MHRHFACALILACLLPAVSLYGQAATPADPKYVSAMSEGKKLAHDRQYAFAMDAYKKANKIAGGKDAPALNALLLVQMSTGSYKDAVKTSVTLDEIAVSPKEKLDAAIDRGAALYQQAGEKGKPELLHAADDAFKAALAIDPKNATALFTHGKTLARLGQMDAAQAEFKACASCLSPKDPGYARVQHFAANPAISVAKMAPVFVVTALDGSKFNLDEMGGRVVLIDFWAT